MNNKNNLYINKQSSFLTLNVISKQKIIHQAKSISSAFYRTEWFKMDLRLRLLGVRLPFYRTLLSFIEQQSLTTFNTPLSGKGSPGYKFNAICSEN